MTDQTEFVLVEHINLSYQAHWGMAYNVRHKSSSLSIFIYHYYANYLKSTQAQVHVTNFITIRSGNKLEPIPQQRNTDQCWTLGQGYPGPWNMNSPNGHRVGQRFTQHILTCTSPFGGVHQINMQQRIHLFVIGIWFILSMLFLQNMKSPFFIFIYTPLILPICKKE